LAIPLFIRLLVVQTQAHGFVIVAIATMHVLTPSRHSTHAITRNMFHRIHGKNFILRTKKLRFDCDISRGNVCLQIREELDPCEQWGRSQTQKKKT